MSRLILLVEKGSVLFSVGTTHHGFKADASTVRPYEITAPLGADGMGKVWKADDCTVATCSAVPTAPSMPA